MNVLPSFSTAEIGTMRSLAAAFEAVTQVRGDAIAVRSGDETVSYAALDRMASSVAHSLQTQGISRGALVAIYLPRGIGMIAAMLGVCKAGAAYLPLDSTFPAVRVLETLADAQPSMVVTDSALQQQLSPLTSVPTLLLADALSALSSPFAEAEGQPADLAYVIYTSGSTGRPKGVMVSQHNVLRLFSQTARWFDFNQHDVWTMFHSFAFDFSVWEIWGCLLTGGTLVIVPHATSRSPEEFYSLLSREGVTVLNQTPTAFGLLSQSVEARDLPLALRHVIFGGEALSFRSLRSWVQRFGDDCPQLANMYGITETTVHVTFRRILRSDIEQETDSIIGEPIPDLQIHLLDENKQPVATGEIGEMYIGGAGVALGYLGRTELTAERFLPVASSNGRLYRSGDLARRRPDGELVYLGRADRQVKINGFRVEPSEVEATLAMAPGVQQVCVAPVDTPDGTRFLAAYFTATSVLDETALSSYMAAKLPVHLRPTFYVQLPHLPLTTNGKVDRASLPYPKALRTAQFAQAETAPLSRQIAEIWASLLQVQHIPDTQNFFDAGGTSLQLMALRTALQQRTGRAVPVLWLFEHTTPKALSERISQESDRGAAAVKQTRAAVERQRPSFGRPRAFRSVSS